MQIWSAHGIWRRPAAVADLAEFLIVAGGVIGGGTALFGALGFIAGSIVKDLSSTIPFLRERGWSGTDPWEWAKRMAPYGGVLGIAALGMRAAGVK